MLIDQLARACLERGHRVGLMCGSPTAPRAYELVALGGEFTQYLRAPVAYARRFRDCDVLVDVENGIPFFSPLWRRGPVVCLVHHVHSEQWRLRFGSPLAALGRALEEKAMPWVYRRCIFVCVSSSTAQALGELGIPAERIRVLPMGVTAAPAPEARSLAPMFLALGRLVPHKRIDLLIRLWEPVREQVGGRLVVIGDGPERARLERLAGPGVEVRGRVSEAEKQELLGRAWVLVHSALHEGWGIAVTEAAAAGTPALAFDVPGVRDAVRDGETGVLASSEDEFVARWTALAADEQARRRLGAAARRQAEATPWSATADALMAALEEAIADGAGAGASSRAR